MSGGEGERDRWGSVGGEGDRRSCGRSIFKRLRARSSAYMRQTSRKKASWVLTSHSSMPGPQGVILPLLTHRAPLAVLQPQFPVLDPTLKSSSSES